MRRCLLVTGRAAPRRPGAPAPGSTLIELIVVLAIIGFLLALVPVAFLQTGEDAATSDPMTVVRTRALREGVRLTFDSAGTRALFFPDGRAIVVTPESPR